MTAGGRFHQFIKGHSQQVSQSSTTSHMTKPSSQGLSRAGDSQGLSSLHACRPWQEPRAGCGPCPQPEAHEAIAHTTGLEAAETPEESVVGVSPQGSWSSQKAAQYRTPYMACPLRRDPDSKASLVTWAVTAESWTQQHHLSVQVSTVALGSYNHRQKSLTPRKAQKGARVQSWSTPRT